MKTTIRTTQKSFWEKLPLPFWTGILGGLIWVVWLSSVLFLQRQQWGLRGEGILSQLVGFMLVIPLLISSGISNYLIMEAHERAMGGTVYLVPYYQAGYIIPFFFFAVVGLIVGLFLNVPERNVRRQRLLIFIAIIMVLWVCVACWLIVVAAMTMD